MYIKSSQQSQLLEAVANIMLQIMENYRTEVPNCKCKSICAQFDDSVCSRCNGNKPAEIYERRKHIFLSHNISQRKHNHFCNCILSTLQKYHLSFAHICNGNPASGVMTIKKENKNKKADTTVRLWLHVVSHVRGLYTHTHTYTCKDSREHFGHVTYEA